MGDTIKIMKTAEEVEAKVKELGGWFDGDVIRFPSIELHEQFKRWRWFEEPAAK